MLLEITTTNEVTGIVVGNNPLVYFAGVFYISGRALEGRGVKELKQFVKYSALICQKIRPCIELIYLV